MREPLVEISVQLLLLLFYVVSATILSGIGLLIEYTSISYLLVGDVLMALWTAVIGGVFLLFAVLVIKQKLLPILPRLLANIRV